ncbi:hypothetical protein CC1G_05063 [Coprinopsis cinerea okayama7|uniref:Nephrocystin 3-like N-terminal domain-containing protein n=1 Tax=Coprinopsis cinerea (strain Okayama-7 / 130 / ATCC MYA-4618 / FGSC 9003) TaxID=240176 RepID=A8NSQ8_COPC7|nr:hypothetical protein CC1G_05063 [Coprinopsis cinerea okayama7\|eukprot:XP_001836070.2 hypothetical protein CC1G_05063 [Coprinopsis cinerea okayama7\
MAADSNAQRLSHCNLPIFLIPVPKDKIKGPDNLNSSHSFKRPGWFQENFLDRYWKNFTSHYLHVADGVRSRHMDNVAAGRPFAPGTKDGIDRSLNTIAELAMEYQSACADKDTVHARAVAQKIQKKASALRVLECLSNMECSKLLENKTAQLSPCYETIVNKRDNRASLLSPLHTIQMCNPKFRKDILMECTTWIAECTRDNCIFWLNGEPGCGKSVVAHWFADGCEKRNSLAASYVFTKPTSTAALLDGFVANLATDFAEYLGDPWRNALVSTATNIGLEKYADQFFTRPLRHQMGKLLVPTFFVIDPTQQKPLLVVLDGLDKCDDFALKALFELIEEAILHLPICFFISSTETKVLTAYLRQGPLSKHVQECHIPGPYLNRPGPNRASTPTPVNINLPASE